jgi:hypothetical protein
LLGGMLVRGKRRGFGICCDFVLGTWDGLDLGYGWTGYWILDIYTGI